MAGDARLGDCRPGPPAGAREPREPRATIVHKLCLSGRLGGQTGGTSAHWCQFGCIPSSEWRHRRVVSTKAALSGHSVLENGPIGTNPALSVHLTSPIPFVHLTSPIRSFDVSRPGEAVDMSVETTRPYMGSCPSTIDIPFQKLQTVAERIRYIEALCPREQFVIADGNAVGE